jgi:imidazolonepropionase-like amidohydrolase
MPHPSLVDEIEELVDYGLPPLDALKAATSRAADALGRPGVGRIAMGSAADFAIVDGDPLSDPGILRSVWAVVKHEQLVHTRHRARAVDLAPW